MRQFCQTAGGRELRQGLVVLGALLWLGGAMVPARCRAAVEPEFGLVGFAAMSGLGQAGTTGGAGGPHVRVSTLADLVRFLTNDTPHRVEVLQDIDLSPLANASGGFPSNYVTGEILVNSDKTLYSRYGATLRRGSLRIGRGSNGKRNVIIRNLRFRDLWVLDPSGQYDQYGWDYIGIEGGSHHVWVDHCDFERVYDGMVDVKSGSDFVTVSWCRFRLQKKCHLVGHSDSAAAAAIDRGHLNVTFHHNWYEEVEERIPRLRFGNAHVFNLFCTALGGRGIQSTSEAATLVENVYFLHPRAGSRPTVEENGGPTGTVKVVNSIIENLPGVNVQFRQHGESNFLFNAPFAGARPPYAYSLDAVEEVPNVVTNHAGVGRIDFELWQMDHFTPEQLASPSSAGRGADPDADGLSNFAEYLAGTDPWDPDSVLRLLRAAPVGPDVLVTWKAGGGSTCVVQAALSPLGEFGDRGAPLPILGGERVETNSVLPGAGGAGLFFRLRLVR